MRRLAAAVIVMLAAGAPAAAAQGGETPPPAPVPTGTLAGIVRDSLGHGLRDVEVVIPDGPRVRTDSAGRFVLAGVTPGPREVWFRRIGFASRQFAWNAQADTRVDVEAHLWLLPHTLDPVLVRAREDRSMRSTSSITGHVVDSTGVPLPNVEVHVIGAGQVMTTRADGSFTFRHVLPGNLTLRARRMGFSPNTVWLQLGEDDQRDVTIRIRELPEALPAVEISERSGFGGDEILYQELDQRQNFRTNNLSAYFGPDALHNAKGMSLDEIALYLLRGPSEVRGPGAGTSIRPDAVTPADFARPWIDGDACILENGVTPRLIPLRFYLARDLEAVEYYSASPPESEMTNTIRSRFGATKCGGMGDGHPPYWVVWLKRSPSTP